jgi:tRNA-dihydrouridine synthase
MTQSRPNHRGETSPNPPFNPAVAIASLSGEADADWASAVEEYIGAAFLGGISLDAATREAARQLVDRGRDEFIPADPFGFIESQLTALEPTSVRPGFNLRSATVSPLERAAAICADHDAIAEINAHCRQSEMCAVGCGERLLQDTNRLQKYVSAAADTGADVSVKIRAEVSGVDLRSIATTIERAGGSMVHIDAMDSEPVVRDLTRAIEIPVIANNGIRDRETTREYLDYGADAVSVGRASDNPAILSRVATAVSQYDEVKIS